jgi:hypothetical protein
MGEADNKVYCIKQRSYFVHHIPVNEFIIWELQKYIEDIMHKLEIVIDKKIDHAQADI